MTPGQMACGQSSALAGAPSMTGGILIIDSSSLGNLKPASLNAFPKSLSLGKSMWQVLQLVPYILENAGIARPLLVLKVISASTKISQKNCIRGNEYRSMSVLLKIRE